MSAKKRLINGDKVSLKKIKFVEAGENFSPENHTWEQ
jgi:hypothetical protein